MRIFLFILIFALSLLRASATVAQPPDEPSVLPFTSSDQVTLRKAGAHRDKTLSGVIEDMSGEIIVLRRGSNTVEILNLREVVSVRFQKSAEYADGLDKIESRDWQLALSALRAAEVAEPRGWVVHEILASEAIALRALGRFSECLTTVEKIFENDPNTRHLVELPLVWDERLPTEQRFPGTLADLKSRSVLRQLTAASALLQDSEQATAAAATLKAVRKIPHVRIQELAEVQLWRTSLLRPESPPGDEIERWTQRARNFDRRLRSGPEFLIGRALLADHDYDQAATSLLWMPLLEPLDPATTAASLREAVTALQLAGRIAEATQFQIELEELTK